MNFLGLCNQVVTEITLGWFVTGLGSPAYSLLMRCSYHWTTSGDQLSGL